ncbi:MAG: transcriptional regulator [Thermoplasmatota archaeon]
MHCEKFVKNYLPSIKANIVKHLYENHNLNQTEISEIMDITQAAVSQYIRGVRGDKNLSDELIEDTHKAANDIYKLYQNDNLTDEELAKIWCKMCKKIL